MANTTTGGSETKISKSIQKFLTARPVFRKLASFAENNTLVKGTSVNRPYRNDFFGYASDYTANTDVTAKDWTVTASNLSIDQSKAVSIKVDPVENKQLQTANAEVLFAKRLSETLIDLMDKDFLDEVSNAALSVDAGDLGGTSGSPITVGTTAEVEAIFGRARSKILSNTDEEVGMYAVIDPYLIDQIAIRGIAQGYNLADSYFKNGFVGSMFAGMDVYSSNKLPSTVDFTIANAIPAAGDTITLTTGITFPFQTTLGTTAGNVLSEVSETQTAANLVAAINGAAGAGTKYVEPSPTVRDRIKRLGIAATSSAGVVTITSYGRLLTSVNFATTANGVFGDQTLSCMVGQYGAIDMVAQMEPHVQINKATNNLGSTYLAHALWGTKTFEDGAQRLLKLSIKG